MGYRLYLNQNDELTFIPSYDIDSYDQDRLIGEREYQSEDAAKYAILAYKFKLQLPLTLLERLKILAALEGEL